MQGHGVAAVHLCGPLAGDRCLFRTRVLVYVHLRSVPFASGTYNTLIVQTIKRLPIFTSLCACVYALPLLQPHGFVQTSGLPAHALPPAWPCHGNSPGATERLTACSSVHGVESLLHHSCGTTSRCCPRRASPGATVFHSRERPPAAQNGNPSLRQP